MNPCMIFRKYCSHSVPLAVLTLLLLAVIPGPQTAFAGASLRLTILQAEGATSETRSSESKLELGKSSQAAGRKISLPLHFTAAEGETVGNIRAEIVVPEGDFEFDRVSLPKDSPLKVSAKKRKEESKDNEGKRTRQTVIEATFSAGSRAIRNGLIGFLQLDISKLGRAESAPKIPGITVRKLETSPPEPELLMGEPSQRPLSMPSEPPTNPAVGCFFFTH